MSKRHRYNLAKINKARPWFLHDRAMAEQTDRFRKAYQAEKEARTLDNAKGYDALTGHALNVAVIECMTIHIQPPAPFPDMQGAEFMDGKTFDEIIDDADLKAAWEKKYHAATLAWNEAHGKNQGVTWGWLKYRRSTGTADAPAVPLPTYFVDGDQVFWRAPGNSGWTRFNPAVDLADAMRVFHDGSYDIHGSGNLSWDADCFDRPEWHCSFSSGLFGRVSPAGINGWGDTQNEAICRAYIHKQTTVRAAAEAAREARRKENDKAMRIYSTW